MIRARLALAALLWASVSVAGPRAARAAGPKGGGRRRVAEVAAGATHTCVRFEDGGVRCWGEGRHGALGRGDTKDIGDDEPASAGADVKLGAPATSLSAGSWVTCAILRGGRLSCWGRGDAGSLGYGNKHDIGDDEDPAAAGDVAVGDVVLAVSTGGGPTCAVLPGGRLRCWGAYSFGALLKCLDPEIACLDHVEENLGIGYDTWRPIGDDETPAAVGDLAVRGGKVVEVACGAGHICVALDSGGVRCWGGGAEGELGDQLMTKPSEPAPDLAVGGKVAEVGVGTWHTCARLRDGRLRCWGYRDDGALGYGKAAIADIPARSGDVNAGGRVTQIALGERHTCALLASGGVRCWGRNDRGQLGYGHTRTVGIRQTPAAAGDVKVGGRVVQISAGGDHTCALLASGGVRCWGANDHGQLGYGHTRDIGDDETPASAGDVPLE